MRLALLLLAGCGPTGVTSSDATGVWLDLRSVPIGIRAACIAWR